MKTRELFVDLGRDKRASKQRGFTLIELLFVMAIIGILGVLSLSAFYVYKDDVEYARAEHTLRDARTAFELGDQEAPVGLSIGTTFSSTTGGPVTGNLATMLPGAVVPADVRLGASYDYCFVENSEVKQTLIVQPCNGSTYTAWVSLCNGLDVQMHNVAFGGC